MYLGTRKIRDIVTDSLCFIIFVCFFLTKWNLQNRLRLSEQGTKRSGVKNGMSVSEKQVMGRRVKRFSSEMLRKVTSVNAYLRSTAGHRSLQTNFLPNLKAVFSTRSMPKIAMIWAKADWSLETWVSMRQVNKSWSKRWHVKDNWTQW